MKNKPKRRKARRLLAAAGAGLLFSACGGIVGPFGNLAAPIDQAPPADQAQVDGPFGNLAAPLDMAPPADMATAYDFPIITNDFGHDFGPRDMPTDGTGDGDKGD